ncbi:hypothetical protein OUZ56_003618 [Daphnia magna]|uniref:Uncharacterized protein n=1 Tax=Daphnia magna TaxID=35525 RepID=A0ABR0A985_9CRUS|nr:hypothetical protein OUZ56_003618 [Daphnia magna]
MVRGNRLIPIPLECPTESVLELEAPTGSDGDGRSLIQLVRPQGICLPRIISHKRLPDKDKTGESDTDLSMSVLAEPIMVSNSPRASFRHSNSPPRLHRSTYVQSGGTAPSVRIQEFPVNRMEIIRRRYADQGFPEQVGQLLLAGSRESTRDAYQSAWLACFASKGDKRKKDVQSPNTTDSTGQKRGRSDPSTLFLEETYTTTILDWPKDVLIAKLSLCMSHLLNQCNLVSDLESSNSILRCQLNDHVLQVGKLEADIVNIKLAFADSVLGASRFCNPSVSPNPSYAMVARGPATSSVLVTKCVAGSEPPVPVDLMAVEKMLDTLNTGLIPSHVRVKNDKMFITLDNELAVSKATDILNKQPEFRSQFSRLPS